MNGPVTQAEFTRVIDTKALPEGGKRFRYEATAAECATIASWLSVIAVTGLNAEVEAAAVDKGGFRLNISFTGELVQTCVVTLERVTTCLQEAFELLYLPEIPRQISASAVGTSIDVDLEHDEPELLVGDMIDAGAAITEHLVLALDPYPRKPGAALEQGRSTVDPALDSPFSVLQELKTGH